MEEIVIRHKTEKDLTQPYILAYTADGDYGIPVQCFLIMDYQKIQIGGNITKALESLFMSFYSFNLQYPPSLSNTYQVLELLFGLRKRGARGTATAGAENVFITLKRKIGM